MLSRGKPFSLWVGGAVPDAFLIRFRFRELLEEAIGAGLGLLVSADETPVIHERVRPPRKALRVSLEEAIC